MIKKKILQLGKINQKFQKKTILYIKKNKIKNDKIEG